MIELMKKRRTIRKFQNRAIEDADLREFINCARLAPSGANLQPLKYAVVKTRPLLDRIFECTAWAAYLKGEGTPREGERPVAYIAILADSEIKSSGYELDAGAAAMSIILAAEYKGVASCWIASVDRDRVQKLLSLDGKYKIISLIALGYPAERSHEEAFAGDIKYYKDAQGDLHVPKRSLEDIIIKFE